MSGFWIISIILIWNILVANSSYTNHVITRNVNISQFNLELAIEKKGVFSETICSQLCLDQHGCHNALYDTQDKICHLFINQSSKYLDILESSPYVYIEDHCSHSFSNGETDGLYHGCPPIGLETAYEDCQDVFDSGNTKDGIYTLLVNGSYMRVHCTLYAGSGYIVILRRDHRPRFSFFRSFHEATVGVGILSSDYFLGLEALHQLTMNLEGKCNNRLVIFLQEQSGSWINAIYEHMSVGEGESYTLTVYGWQSIFPITEGSFDKHNGSSFSAWDKDQDIAMNDNCAIIHPGMWWFRGCHSTLPTGLYYDKQTGLGSGNGIPWLDRTTWKWIRMKSVVYMISRG